MKYLIVPLLMLCLSACSKSDKKSQTLFHEDGRAKPKICLIPIIDNSRSELPWNVADELTEAIEKKICQKKRLFLAQDDGILTRNTNMGKMMCPFINEANWLCEARADSEFVLFAELLEHTITSKHKGGTLLLGDSTSYSLDISVRIRVADLRDKTPQIILQEILHESYPIPSQLAHLDYSEGSWARSAYPVSPIGLAHSQLVKKIVSQVEDYVLLAKTR